MRNCLTE